MHKHGRSGGGVKQQKYPNSVIKVGAILYQVSAYSYEGKVCIDVNEWHVKTIRKKRGSQTKKGSKVAEHMKNDALYVNIVQKVDDVTWGRLSRKVGDIGWYSTIPAFCKKQFTAGADLPLSIYTTKLQAFKFALHLVNETIDDMEKALRTDLSSDDRLEYEADLAQEKLILKSLKSSYTRFKNRSN